MMVIVTTLGRDQIVTDQICIALGISVEYRMSYTDWLETY